MVHQKFEHRTQLSTKYAKKSLRHRARARSTPDGVFPEFRAPHVGPIWIRKVPVEH